MATYFGLNAAPTYNTYYGANVAIRNSAQVWKCPGTGDQIVKSLEMYGYYASGGANVRLAIYSADGQTKLCEGTAEVALGATPGAWKGYVAQANMSPNPCTLQGGTNYLLVVSWDAAIYLGQGDDGNGGMAQIAADYTGGFPATIGAGTSTGWYQSCFRCGVDPASAGGGITTRQAHTMSLGTMLAIARRIG